MNMKNPSANKFGNKLEIKRDNKPENKRDNKSDRKPGVAAPYELQDFYNHALFFAAEAHGNQLYGGSPYILHVCMVADEIFAAHQKEPFSNIENAVQIALLHDVLEDTHITENEMLQHFSSDVVSGVKLLTKHKGQPLRDYLSGIKKGDADVSKIKMCDRIINLQRVPSHWNADKILEYDEESLLILERLGESSRYISQRLKLKIELYEEMFMVK